LIVVVQTLAWVQLDALMGEVTTVSGTPFSSRIVSVIVAVDGMLVVCTTTGMGELELIVISGKLLGFGVMAVPFMLITCAAGAGAVGRNNGKGVD